jgi:hypothetical protein
MLIIVFLVLLYDDAWQWHACSTPWGGAVRQGNTRERERETLGRSGIAHDFLSFSAFLQSPQQQQGRHYGSRRKRCLKPRVVSACCYMCAFRAPYLDSKSCVCFSGEKKLLEIESPVKLKWHLDRNRMQYIIFHHFAHGRRRKSITSV